MVDCRHHLVNPKHQISPMSTPPPPPPPAPPTKEQILAAEVPKWLQLKQWLSTAKVQESALRKRLADLFFSDQKQNNGHLPAGTLTALAETDISSLQAKVSQKYTYEVDESSMCAVLTEAQLTPAEAEGLIRVKYELSLKVYKALPEAKRAIVDKMIVVKPGSIELEINLVPKS